MSKKNDSSNTPFHSAKVSVNNANNGKADQPLSNSLRLRAPKNAGGRQKVASILQRLPFLRQLDQAKSAILTLSPIWQQWCESVDQQNQPNSLSLATNAALSSIDQGTLTITCKQSSVASLLKHQQASLLDAFNRAGFEHINKLRIQMALATDLNTLKSETSDSQNRNDESNAAKREKPSESSIKSIEAAQSHVQNEQLAASLKRLAQTLKKAT